MLLVPARSSLRRPDQSVGTSNQRKLYEESWNLEVEVTQGFPVEMASKTLTPTSDSVKVCSVRGPKVRSGP